MAYSDGATIYNPTTGTVVPVAWLDQINDNMAWLANPDQVSLTGLASTCTTNVFTDLDIQTELIDTAGMHSGTNRYVTIQTAGQYLFTAAVDFDANNTGARLIRFRVNGATNYDLSQVTATSATNAVVLNGVQPLSLSVGDTVRVQARQNSGGNLDVTCTSFYGRWMGTN